MATTYLTRTPSSGAAVQKATFSFWVKKSNTTGTPNLFRMYTGSTQYVRIRFEASNKLSFIIINSDSYVVQLITTQVFTDTSGWYNIVCNLDTTQSTASDRAKIYVNGEKITAYDTATYPPTQNASIIITPSGTANNIGAQVGNSPSFFEGVMSHVQFTDGYVYEASSFGETDSETGEWKINTSPSVTYGTNGFFILKDGNSVTDQSGNSNNFTVGAGTLTKTEDNPSNVFATLNPLDNFYASHVFSNGATSITTPTSTYSYNTSTLAASAGKFYYEVKIVTLAVDTTIGIAGSVSTGTTYWLGSSGNIYGYSYTQGGSIYNNNSAIATGYATYAVGDIVSIAFDLTNNKLYSGKNGVWNNSANPAGNTGGVSITAASSTTMGAYSPAIGEWSGDAGAYNINFGNGYFATTAVASAGTNASANGIFEFDVPTGFTALSTKGLNL